MRIRQWLGRCAAAVVLFGAGTYAQGLTINLDPASASGPVGSSFGFDVVASGYPDLISTYDIDVLFDPTLLSFVSASGEKGTGPAFTPPGFQAALNGPGNRLNLSEFSSLSDAQLLTLQGGNPIVLSSFVLRGLVQGPTSLDLFVNALGGSTPVGGNTQDLLALLSAGPTITNAAELRITPGALVPEPGSVLLVALGVLLLAARTRRLPR